jgi:hypothetical protein
MTLDEMIRTDLKRAASEVTWVPPTEADEIRRRGRRRLVRRRVTWAVASVALILPVLAVALSFDPNSISPADTENVDVVEIADLAVAVTDTDPVLTDPDVWIGLPGPAPLFDTSELGPDLSFTPGEPAVGDLDEQNMRNDGWPTGTKAVYLGDLEGEPFYLYSAPAPSIWDRIFEVIDGNFSGDVLGTSLNCCTGGDMDHEEGMPGFGHSSSTEGGVTTEEMIYAEWLGLSTNVSVVAYRFDGEFIGWQRPVGGATGFIPESVPSEITYITFDAQGRELDRIHWSLGSMTDTSTPNPLPELPGDDWAPLASKGEAIEATDIHDEALLASVDPQPGDLLFRVSLEGDEMIVRLRDQQPHVFARSCESLEATEPPPGWPTTCLD